MKENIKIGLALGSGAARGIAHIGVIQVLEEKRIPVHMVAGSSIGALVGALYCCGLDAKMMGKIVIHLNEKDYFDFTIPRKGFIRGNRIDVLVQTLTRNKSFEDLDIPLAVVACDLNESKKVVFNSGKLYKAVRASISIPGIFEPVEMDGQTLVDGGVIDRVPINILREMGADIVIGVDVGFRGSHQKANGILEIILQSLEVMEWEMIQHKIVNADILISPEIQTINPASLSQAEECINFGRAAALAAIPAIMEKLKQTKYKSLESVKTVG